MCGGDGGRTPQATLQQSEVSISSAQNWWVMQGSSLHYLYLQLRHLLPIHMSTACVSWWILLSRASVNWVGLQYGPGTSGVSGSGGKCCRCLLTFSCFFPIQKSSYSSSFVSWIPSVITISIFSGPSE